MKRMESRERIEKTAPRRAWGICVCTALCLLGAHAVEVSTVDELVAAMRAVNERTSSDTKIRLRPGYYDVSGCTMNSDGHLYIARAMQFEGVDDTSWRATSDSNTAVVIDAKGVNTIFRFDVSETRGNTRGTSFRNMTFVNGYARKKGDETGTYTDTYPRGGALGNNSYLAPQATVSNCVFRSNYAAAQGGALMMCNVYDCYFTNNVAAGDGGAVCAVGNLEDSLLVNNRTTAIGGAVRNAGFVKRCVFIGNRGADGCCIYGGQLEVSDTVCISNVSISGGACFRPEKKSDMCVVRNCRFEGNVSEKQGPSGVNDISLVTNCVFVGNFSRGGGMGVVRASGDKHTVIDCYFTNNVSGSDLGGAGVTGVEGCPPPRVTGCVFVGNMAMQGGGVSRADVSNCLFVANCATNGGGVYQCPRVADCLFVSNTASYGGGAFACSNLTECTFQDCAAWSDGGCAYDSSLFGCFVTNCTVLRGGDFVGGVSATTADGWLAQGTTFVDCRSSMSTNVWWATRRLRQVDCTFIRCGVFENTAAVRCTFTGVTGEGFPSSILVKGVATNCLIAGCQAKYLLERMDEVVNCTVVSNNLGTTGQLFAGPIRAINCIFRDNYHYDPKTSPALHYDIAGYGQWTLENCLYKTFPDWGATFTIAPTDCVTDGVNPFLSPTHPDYDPAQPYGIGLGSPARNAGKAIDWPAGFTDLAGHPRVFNDRTDSPRVDIGAYECCLLPRGTCLIFR